MQDYLSELCADNADTRKASWASLGKSILVTRSAQLPSTPPGSTIKGICSVPAGSECQRSHLPAYLPSRRSRILLVG